MDSNSVADQLDDAIEKMVAGPSAPPAVDLRSGELLAIAAELCWLPDPVFRRALKADLLGQREPGRPGVRGRTPALVAVPRLARRDEQVEQILPTLLAAGGVTYPVRRGNFAISAALHLALVAMAATAGLWLAKPPLRPQATSVLFTDMVPLMLPASVENGGGGGGGGDRDKLAESKGSLPRFDGEQITPPAVVVRHEQPKLPMESTLVGPPVLTVPPTSPIGDPLSGMLQAPSNGTGVGGGIGSGGGGGIGAGEGPGFGPGWGGGAGGGVFRVGGGVSAPRPIYDPDPDYSEQARQAKFQGTVLLWVVVGADGRPRDIQVARSVGMGLDEKAIEAVKRWKFEPSMREGRPVAVQVNIEVSFRLY
ncbi:MAG: energy transducer TonB [Terriglobales bacterium]|jgi:TonB family protein